MTEQDQKKWNSRYLKNIGGSEPSDILSRYINIATKGRALDIACGNGRNSKFLVQRGFEVDAVDISNVALNQLPDTNTRMNIICQDIDTWQIPQSRYQLIINIRFLDRRLFPMIKKGLKPGGVLIFESFIDEKKSIAWKPMNYYMPSTLFRSYIMKKRRMPPLTNLIDPYIWLQSKNESDAVPVEAPAQEGD